MALAEPWRREQGPVAEQTGSLPVRLARSCDGQILPFVVVVMFALLAAGLLVFWLGFGTALSAKAQTAADAAALAGEQTAVNQLESPGTLVGGVYQPSAINWSQACNVAEQYAEHNNAHDLSCKPVANSNSLIGYDLEVVSESNSVEPSSAPDSGHGAVQRARASTNPFARASPAVATKVAAPSKCTASAPSLEVTGSALAGSGSGSDGFSASGGANYSYGCEPQIAAALQAVARARHVHLTGTAGYVPVTTADAAKPGAVAHGCGDASMTSGLSGVPTPVLRRFGLLRPYPDQPGLVELAGVSCQSQSTSVDGSASGAISIGNTNVHLVDWNTGGPTGSLFSLLGGGASSLGETPLEVGCQVYRVWQALGVKDPELLFVALDVAQTESGMGQNIGPNTTDPNQSVGVYQQISADGWGTPPEELNVTTAAEMFFMGAHNGTASTEGLLQHYAADPGAEPWQLAQATQGSGAGQSTDGAANYGNAANMDAARQMEATVQSGACPKS